MKEASLSIDNAIDTSVEDGRINMSPARVKEYSPEALLSGITTENVHGKVEFGKVIGKKIL